MTRSIELTPSEYKNLRTMMKLTDFTVKEQDNGKYLLSSDENVKWWFRRIYKDDIDKTKAGVELWRYLCNKEIDETTMVCQCTTLDTK